MKRNVLYIGLLTVTVTSLNAQMKKSNDLSQSVSVTKQETRGMFEKMGSAFSSFTEQAQSDLSTKKYKKTRNTMTINSTQRAIDEQVEALSTLHTKFETVYKAGLEGYLGSIRDHKEKLELEQAKKEKADLYEHLRGNQVNFVTVGSTPSDLNALVNQMMTNQTQLLLLLTGLEQRKVQVSDAHLKSVYRVAAKTQELNKKYLGYVTFQGTNTSEFLQKIRNKANSLSKEKIKGHENTTITPKLITTQMLAQDKAHREALAKKPEPKTESESTTEKKDSDETKKK